MVPNTAERGCGREDDDGGGQEKGEEKRKERHLVWNPPHCPGSVSSLSRVAVHTVIKSNCALHSELKPHANL